MKLERSLVINVRATLDEADALTEYIIARIPWKELGVEWLSIDGWPTKEVFLMPCTEDSQPVVEP